MADASLPARRRTVSKISFMAGLAPTREPSPASSSSRVSRARMASRVSSSRATSSSRERSLSVSRGLVRKSRAPFFMASTARSMLPWAVTTMVSGPPPPGSAASRSSRPLSSGRTTSATRMSWDPGVRSSRASAAVATASTVWPQSRIRSVSTSRVVSSSSTTRILSSSAGIRPASSGSGRVYGRGAPVARRWARADLAAWRFTSRGNLHEPRPTHLVPAPAP